MKYAVRCFVHGLVELSDREYLAQLDNPDSLWVCPECGQVASWDDATYDAWLDSLPDEPDLIVPDTWLDDPPTKKEIEAFRQVFENPDDLVDL